MEGDVAPSWYLQDLCGNYGVYAAFTGRVPSTHRNNHINPVTARRETLTLYVSQTLPSVVFTGWLYLKVLRNSAPKSCFLLCFIIASHAIRKAIIKKTERLQLACIIKWGRKEILGLQQNYACIVIKKKNY